ncbi:hypothetical protein PBRA_001052, partial [Plasmodiophora brassicae]
LVTSSGLDRSSLAWETCRANSANASRKSPSVPYTLDPMPHELGTQATPVRTTNQRNGRHEAIKRSAYHAGRFRHRQTPRESLKGTSAYCSTDVLTNGTVGDQQTGPAAGMAPLRSTKEFSRNQAVTIEGQTRSICWATIALASAGPVYPSGMSMRIRTSRSLAWMRPVPPQCNT